MIKSAVDIDGLQTIMRHLKGITAAIDKSLKKIENDPLKDAFVKAGFHPKEKKDINGDDQ